MTPVPSIHRLEPMIAFFGMSFVLHLLWENAQAPFYQGYTSFSQHVWICLKAAATGDMLFMLVIYAALALRHRDILWVANAAIYTRPATWIIAILTGLLLAAGFEFWAVNIVHHWQYGSMPTVFGIGLLPMLQMIVVPSLTLSLCRSSLRGG